MATWRRRDLERRSGERSRRMAGFSRVEFVIPLLALVVAVVALWQAMAAQSRAELLAHDLATANGQLHSLEGFGAPSARTTPGVEGDAALPPMTPVGQAPAPGTNP